MALVICVGCSMWMTCVTSWANNGMSATYMLLLFTEHSWVPNPYLETWCFCQFTEEGASLPMGSGIWTRLLVVLLLLLCSFLDM
jgi:hypothetical protein